MSNYNDLVIVGIGASAGGFEAFQKFIPRLPQSRNISYIIAQHLDPKRPTLFGELLSKYSAFEIKAVNDGEQIAPNCIYYCPPSKDVTIEKGVFRLTDPESKSYPKPSINKFFESLASEKKEKSVGIILSGTGSDGAKGILAIAEHGGIALSEDEGAKYYSMPKAAIDTGKVIASLPPELLAEGIEHIINDRSYFEKHFALQDSTNKIFEILNKKTDIDFSSYKEATITRRIKKRMNETKSKGVDDYLQLLEDDNGEVERLKDELLIIVTSFFRDKEAFWELKKEFYSVIENKLYDGNLRIWSAGCATGEEAYTIAIIICEILEELGIEKKVTIFATDVSERIINQSRNRIFTLDQMEDIDPKYLHKYFDYHNDVYKPNKAIRDMIVFSKHDLIKDPPFLNLDLVSCRNLLIYFDNELQKRILSIFYYSMRYESLLFLGKSETVGTLNSLFSIVHNKYKIYRKSNDMGRIDIDTLTYVKNTNFQMQSTRRDAEHIRSVDIDFSISKAISNKYGQNGIVVDGTSYNILFYKGDCKEYITHPKGLQTNDVFRLLIDYLKLNFRATLNEAQKTKLITSSKKVRVMPIGEPKEYITIDIFPLEKNKLGEDTYFVTFNKSIDYAQSVAKNAIFDPDPTLYNEYEVNVLEDELNTLKERLQITIEELETSNEELQSTNEELQTVNDELGFSNLELEFSNKAFNSVIESLDAHIIILDQKLNIIKYTDGIIRFFNIIRSSDMNFSTILLNSTINLPNLMDDLKECLHSNKQTGYDIEYHGRNYYFSLRKIDISVEMHKNAEMGIVISFVDKTELTKKDKILFQQSKMASMGEMMGNIAHQWRQPLTALSGLVANTTIKYHMNKLDEEYMEHFNTKSNDLIQKMSQTIDDFRNFFKPTKEKSRFHIASVIEESLAFMEDSLMTHGIQVHYNNIDNFVLESFKNELMQVIINLISNSKDAIKGNRIKEGSITLTTQIEHGVCKIMIEDNGGGVKSDIIERLFEPYFTTKFESSGTGLGLYMSKMIIENSIMGKLSLVNHNNGVLVTISIPHSK